jgi:hypothetical protein
MQRRKLWLPIATVLIIAIAFSLYIFIAQHNKKPAKKLVQSNSFTGEKPTFTIYYPSSAPAGISIDRGSVKTAKDIFSFNLKQNGSQDFAVTEQSAGDNFDVKDFKKKLTSAQDFDTDLGQGVIGGLDKGLITAVKTKTDTLIIVNCVNTLCSIPSREILNNMKIVSDLSTL